jgi:two-component SAPR family response regulator
VECLGAFHVSVGGNEISQERWVSAKARDLLAYFVTFRGERIPAERVLDAIWGEKGSSRTAFHTALSRLRNALRTGETSTAISYVETGEYWLDSTRFRIDVDEFNAAFMKARSSNEYSAAIHWYEHAVEFYRENICKICIMNGSSPSEDEVWLRPIWVHCRNWCSLRLQPGP